MSQSINWKSFGRELVIALALLMSGQAAAAAWWEHPHDKWYLKDDWKAARVQRYSPAFNLQSPAASGWVVVWGDRGVQSKINGKTFMNHIDRALIYDADLTSFIKGAIDIKLEFGPGDIVAEGEFVDARGRRYPFASGCDWPAPVAPGAQLSPAPHPHRPGESSGAFHSAHNGLLMRYNDEETGKTEIAKTLARIQKLRDQSIFLLRRYRHPSEILSFDPSTLWRCAERHASAPMAQAEKILKEQAIPAQKQGKFTEAIRFAGQAATLVAAAELAIDAACQLEELERQEQHLAACAKLITQAGMTAPAIDRDLEEVHNMLGAARREAGSDDWGNALKRAVAARDSLSRLSEQLSALWGSPIGKPDEYSNDRFGWFNAPALMGNDPSLWEFSLVNPEANWIDLRGVWMFRLDPPNNGLAQGWHKPDATIDGWRKLYAPLPWERQGARDDNEFSPWDCPYKLTDQRCEDKPYNGYAWYRRNVHIPKQWRGKTVVLRVGKVANWMQVYLNGHPVGTPQKDQGAVNLPEEFLKHGQLNTIAIQVYNHDNFGGIISGPVCLSVDSAEPQQITTPGPMSFTTETAINTSEGVERLTVFSPAMSPAVVCASDATAIRVWDWESKGYALPSTLLFMTSSGPKQIELNAIERQHQESQPSSTLPNRATVLVNGADLTESWLLLSGSQAGVNNDSFERPSPVLFVLENRPQSIEWIVNELGYHELRLNYASNNNRFIVLRFNRQNQNLDPEACESWAKTLRAVPVACSELARIDAGNLRGEFFLRYNYWELPDFTGAKAVRSAPVPQLLSYGIKHNFPGIELSGFQTSSYASEHAPYRHMDNNQTLRYSTPIVDKSKLLKGVGELFAKQRPELNSRGGLTEHQMFDDWKEWGFDHCRYAFAWGADWDLPLQNHVGGAVTDDPKLWQRLDDIVIQQANRGIMAMLCYFFNEDSPQKDSKNLARNSTRYWRMRPETRANCYELWRKIAERYAHYPANSVAYDFFNEPAYMWQEDWNQIIKDLTAIVRSVDKQHLIVCEAGDGWSQPQWFLWLEPTGDTNTIYSFHHYGKHWGYDYDEYYPGYKSTPEKQIEILLEAILFAIKHNVPLHCGEFGVSMISPGEDHLAWLNDYLAIFERFGIGWNWWNWDGNNIYRTGLRAGDEISPNLKILRKWIDRKTWATGENQMKQ